MPKTLATATVDRLLHHAHVCQTSGESVRLSQTPAGRAIPTDGTATFAETNSGEGQQITPKREDSESVVAQPGPGWDGSHEVLCA
jgi:IstB-like ATP binding protein